jgi:uncharacterized protein (TIGR04255 family)
MASDRSGPDLPTFETPPVIEVLLSIQFASIAGFGSIQAGMLWQELREVYPTVSERAPLEPVFETFGERPPSSVPLRFEALLTPPMPRFWFETSDREHLVQVQQDRLVHNWRRIEGRPYPRYEAIRTRFHQEMGRITAFLAREKLSAPLPNQCEVTYINIITLPDGANPHVALERITSLWGGWEHDDTLGPIETADLKFFYLMRADGHPIGRVHVTFRPVWLLTDSSPAIQLEITARGKPRDASLESAFRLLDAERQEIVRTFKHVTTPEMHTLWKYTNEP